jgi:methylated-DNA-[protein]-cysteine S-methyltransferase
VSSQETVLLADEIPSAIGTIVLAARARRLCALDYADCRERFLALLRARYAEAALRFTPDPFGFSSRIRSYLAGEFDATEDIPVETKGTRFQERVWTALRRIPPGATVTYAEVARGVGRPLAARAVGGVNRRNPVAIVIPCHRVIGTDRSLTGYAGGIWRKRWLLSHEGKGTVTSPTPRAVNRGA